MKYKLKEYIYKQTLRMFFICLLISYYLNKLHPLVGEAIWKLCILIMLLESNSYNDVIIRIIIKIKIRIT